MGAEHYGEERQETALARAERIVNEELKRRGGNQGSWSTRPKEILRR